MPNITKIFVENPNHITEYNKSILRPNVTF